jgi:hypothetical protein
MKTLLGLAALISVSSSACGSDTGSEVSEEAASGLTAVCVSEGGVPDGAWRCGQERVTECASPDGTPIDFLYVVPPGSTAVVGPSCDDADYVVNEIGPFDLGDHVIVVTDDGTTVCQSTMRVRDTRDPVAVVHTTELWLPNHKMHRFTPADCVTVRDACDGEIPAHFTFATVDEAPDVNGAGKTGEADIEALGCDGVDVRVERAGGSNARVYTLGWRARDAAGHVVEGTCQAIVPHDQGGGGTPVTAGAAAVRLEGPAGCAL